MASYTVLFNTTATHGLPAALNQASNALLRTVTGNPEARIALRNYPLPTLPQEAAVEFSKVAGQSLCPLYVPMTPRTASPSALAFGVVRSADHAQGSARNAAIYKSTVPK